MPKGSGDRLFAPKRKILRSKKIDGDISDKDQEVFSQNELEQTSFDALSRYSTNLEVFAHIAERLALALESSFLGLAQIRAEATVSRISIDFFGTYFVSVLPPSTYAVFNVEDLGPDSLPTGQGFLVESGSLSRELASARLHVPGWAVAQGTRRFAKTERELRQRTSEIIIDCLNEIFRITESSAITFNRLENGSTFRDAIEHGTKVISIRLFLQTPQASGAVDLLFPDPLGEFLAGSYRYRRSLDEARTARTSRGEVLSNERSNHLVADAKEDHRDSSSAFREKALRNERAKLIGVARSDESERLTGIRPKPTDEELPPPRSTDEVWARINRYAAENPGEPVSEYGEAQFALLEQSTQTEPEAPKSYPPLPKTAPMFWSNRRGRISPPAFIAEVYGKWLGDGGPLTRATLRTLDPDLYNAYAQHISRHPDQEMPFSSQKRRKGSWIEQVLDGREASGDLAQDIREVRALLRSMERKQSSLKTK